MQKNPHSQVFNPRTVQLVASRYTFWAIPGHINFQYNKTWCIIYFHMSYMTILEQTAWKIWPRPWSGFVKASHSNSARLVLKSVCWWPSGRIAVLFRALVTGNEPVKHINSCGICVLWHYMRHVRQGTSLAKLLCSNSTRAINVCMWLLKVIILFHISTGRERAKIFWYFKLHKCFFVKYLFMQVTS